MPELLTVSPRYTQKQNRHRRRPSLGPTIGSAGVTVKVRRLNLYVAILLACSSFAQAQQTLAIDEVLSRLIAYSKDYRTKLPSLECDESIVSQQVKGDKVKWE